jgi:signal transduction histidine kinase
MARILIIDDDTTSRVLMSRVLEDAGHQIDSADDGAIALQELAIGQASPATPAGPLPDLILFDIHMPGMDGYDTCSALKSDERFKDVPVIFLSSLSDTDDKVKAFSASGVDYVTKPFQRQEVIARVETHLRLARLQGQLEERYEQLKNLEDMRDLLTHMIVHDLRSPLTGIVTSLELLSMDIAPLGEESEEDMSRALNSARTLTRMITTLLDVNKMESGEMPVERRPGDLGATARTAVESLAGLVSGREVTVEGSAAVDFDPELIERVVANLVSNALKYSPEDSAVCVRVSNGVRARIEVRDQGPGVPEQYRDMIFEKFGQIKPKQEGVKLASTGLGLTFCKLAVEAHEGRIGVDSVAQEGSTFWFEL